MSHHGMRFFFLMTFFLFPILGKGQNGQQIGITVTPTYNYKLSNSSLTVPKLGYSLGIDYKREISKKWHLKAGFHLSNKGMKSKLIRGRSLSLPPIIVCCYREYYNYQYIDLPVRFQYDLLQEEIRLFGFVGISPNWLLNATTQLKEDETFYLGMVGNMRRPGLRRFNIQGLLGVGIAYPLSEKWIFSFEAIGRVSLFSAVNNRVHEYLWSAGGELGISYSF